jgi:hypothetical protein
VHRGGGGDAGQGGDQAAPAPAQLQQPGVGRGRERQAGLGRVLQQARQQQLHAHRQVGAQGADPLAGLASQKGQAGAHGVAHGLALRVAMQGEHRGEGGQVAGARHRAVAPAAVGLLAGEQPLQHRLGAGGRWGEVGRAGGVVDRGADQAAVAAEVGDEMAQIGEQDRTGAAHRGGLRCR